MKTGVVTKSTFGENGCRIDPSFHLSEGVAVRRLVESSPYPLMKCGDVASRIFNGGRYKRIYVSNPKHGVPLISSSGMLKADLSDAKLVSKKFSPELEDRLVKAGWILISRSGTIGNTAFTNAGHAQKLASEHVIRLKPNDILRSGYVYAYLSSKFGYSLLTQGTFGSVIQHIECPHVASLPIPVFPTELQNEIDGLIRSAATLRDQANELLAECVADIEKALTPEITNRKTGTVSIKDIKASHNRRFEANYHISSGAEVDKYIRGNFEWKPLSDCCEKIFRPGIFKRQYVKSGVMFLGGADILNAIPSSDKFLGKSQIANMPELLVNENWLLVTCGGTIGNCVMVNRPLSKCAISQHVMRIVPNAFPIGYVFAFLQSKYGQALIQKNPFGAVIPQMEPEHFKRLAIPLLSNPLIESINNRIMDYKECFSKATEYERKAISMVETEIESWNHKPTKK